VSRRQLKIRRGVCDGEAVEPARQMERLALAGLPPILAEPDMDRLRRWSPPTIFPVCGSRTNTASERKVVVRITWRSHRFRSHRAEIWRKMP